MDSAISIPDPLAHSSLSEMSGTAVSLGAASRRRRSLSRGKRGRRNDGRAENIGNNLHVRGLDRGIDDRMLEETFSKAGRVQKIQVVCDPHTRVSRGFGFITMESPEEAEAAIALLNATEMMGKVITVERARRSRARTPTPGKYFGPPKASKSFDERDRYDLRPYETRERYPHRRGRSRSRSRDRYREYDRKRGRDYDYGRGDRGTYDEYDDVYDYRRSDRDRDRDRNYR
ncbi:RNA-binding domain-containing protein [Marasmius fiardii PR-910]|nr:RNA-binding domain-containing protein [Marasmius fiardii PR-910]